MSDGGVEFCQKSIWLLFNPSPQKLLFLRCLPFIALQCKEEDKHNPLIR